jgi:GT2 family glycosyltransferase
MQVTAILVNWQNYRDTLACLQSLQPCFAQGLSVVVVENASPNESYRELAAWQKRHSGAVHLLQADENRGFAAGNNLGIRFALAHLQADFLWLLNSDTEVLPGCLTALIEAARRRPQILIWGSSIYDHAPPHRLQCAGGFRYLPLLSLPLPIRFSAAEMPQGLFHPLPQMDYVSGVSLFVRTEVFREKGLMDESYFLYYEELELTHKVGGKAKLGWCPDSKLYHKGGQSTGNADPNRGRGSALGHYHGNLSALRYSWRHHKWFFPWIMSFRFVAKSLLFARQGNGVAWRALLRAYRDFFQGRNE